MTEQEIKTCLEALSLSERTKFEDYLKERSQVSYLFQMSTKLESGVRMYDFSCRTGSGKNLTIIIWAFEGSSYAVQYIDGVPKEIKCVSVR